MSQTKDINVEQESRFNIWSKIAIILIAASLGISFSCKLSAPYYEAILSKLLLLDDWSPNPLVHLVCLNSVLLSISFPTSLVIKATTRLLFGSVLMPWFACLISFILHITAIQISTLFTFSLIRCGLFKDLKEKISKCRLYQAINQLAKNNGVLLVLLTRLSPIIPFTFSNLILSFTDVSILKVMFGNFSMLLIILSILSSYKIDIRNVRLDFKAESQQVLFSKLRMIDNLINLPLYFTCIIILFILIIHKYIILKGDDKVSLNNNTDNMKAHLIDTDKLERSA